jgi:hypothetical protein
VLSDSPFMAPSKASADFTLRLTGLVAYGRCQLCGRVTHWRPERRT